MKDQGILDNPPILEDGVHITDVVTLSPVSFTSKDGKDMGYLIDAAREQLFAALRIPKEYLQPSEVTLRTWNLGWPKL